jgi:hypothetical protein
MNELRNATADSIVSAPNAPELIKGLPPFKLAVLIEYCEEQIKKAERGTPEMTRLMRARLWAIQAATQNALSANTRLVNAMVDLLDDHANPSHRNAAVHALTLAGAFE